MTKEKNNIKIVVLIVIATITIGIVVYIWQNSKITEYNQGAQERSKDIINHNITSTSTNDILVKNEFFSYSLKGVPAIVTKEELPFDFTAATLKSESEDCGSKHADGYFDKLIAIFKGINKIVYNFTYQGTSQTNLVLKITVLPNKPGYISLDQFKKDFDQCFIAGDAYPWALNKDWLLFVNSCGSGIDDESGRPDGCGNVSAAIKSNLKLNY